MADNHHRENRHIAIFQFAGNFVRRRKMTVERQKFPILIFQDGGRICIETLRTQMLESITTVHRARYY